MASRDPNRSDRHPTSRCAVALTLVIQLSLSGGCTQQVDTGHAPVVIAMADVIAPARPASPASDDESTTDRPTLPDPMNEAPFDPAALLEETQPHDQCVAQLLPSATEDRWLEIDWRSDLLRARREANAEGKPMFMWLMDGNPLGCT